MQAGILTLVKAIRTALTDVRAARLDADISSRAPASTALSNAVWTDTKAGYIDKALSEIAGGEVAGDTLNEVTFTSNGTFTVPSGFKGFVYVTLVGGGGCGGAYGTVPNPDVAGGGGGGGAIFYRWPIWIDQSQVASVSVTVAASQATLGAAGNDSSFGSYLTAYGGGGGGSGSSSSFRGGQGGQLTGKGQNDYDAGAGEAGELLLLLPPVFPAYRNMRCGFFCPGGSGSEGEPDGSAGNVGGASMIAQTLSNDSQIFYDPAYGVIFTGEGSNVPAFSTVRTGVSPNEEEGCGGNSWGLGANSLTVPAANSGGGGAGEAADGSPNASAGGSGLCIVEYWT